MGLLLMLSIQWQLLIISEPDMPQPAELERAAEVIFPIDLKGVV